MTMKTSDSVPQDGREFLGLVGMLLFMGFSQLHIVPVNVQMPTYTISDWKNFSNSPLSSEK